MTISAVILVFFDVGHSVLKKGRSLVHGLSQRFVPGDLSSFIFVLLLFC